MSLLFINRSNSLYYALESEKKAYVLRIGLLVLLQHLEPLLVLLHALLVLVLIGVVDLLRKEETALRLVWTLLLQAIELPCLLDVFPAERGAMSFAGVLDLASVADDGTNGNDVGPTILGDHTELYTFLSLAWLFGWRRRCPRCWCLHSQRDPYTSHKPRIASAHLQ